MPQAQKYDPNSPAPYQPYQAPQPPPQEAPPAFIQQPGFQFTGAPNTTLGNVAGALDNVFRGYMRGKFEGDARKLMQMKAKTDNLQNSYNQDAKILFDMAQSGVDQNSQEYKQAVSAVQGSWGALQDWESQHVNGEDTTTGKRRKTKSAQKASADPMADLKSDDPNVRAQALYALRQKMGPPVLWQVRQFYTPEVQAARKAQGQAAQNAVTATGLETGALQHQATTQQAQAIIDELNKTPRDQWTDKQRQQYDAAAQALQPVQVLKPGEEAQTAVDQIVRNMEADPNYKLTDHDKQIFEAAGIHIDPKKRIQVTSRGEIVESDEDGNFTVLRGPQREYEPRGRSGDGAGGSDDKAYKKWDAYYKQHYPEMDPEDRDALVKRKVEGASQHQVGQIQYDAITEPRKFDNAVLTAAIDRIQSLPEYRNVQNFPDILANLVGQDQEGYAYNTRQPVPRKDGDFSGNPKAAKVDLQKLDRDLQEQIRAVLNDPKNGLSQDEKRAAMARMRPLYGPASRPAGSGTPPGAPPTQAAPPAASASSPAPQGGQNPSDPLGILH